MSKKTADEIMDMDDRESFPVDVPEWGRIGVDACVVKTPDIYTLSVIETSCDASAEGRAKRSARIIIEGCIDPKFGPEHETMLMTKKSPVAIGRLVLAIFEGKFEYQKKIAKANAAAGITTI